MLRAGHLMSHDHPVKQGRKCCAVINRFKLMSDIFIPSSYQSEDFQDASSTYNMCGSTVSSLQYSLVTNSISQLKYSYLLQILLFGAYLASSFDSSVGRAVDCSGKVIHRSLVRIRLEGLNFFFFFPPFSHFYFLLQLC